MPDNPKQTAPELAQPALRRRFRPSLWSVLLTLLGCAAFIALGIWQIDRGEGKARRDAQVAAAAQTVPKDLADMARDLPPPPQGMVVARAEGRYLDTQQLLLYGQSDGTSVGYDVLTPLKMADGSILIVNRGWVPGHDDRKQLPAVPVGSDMRKIRGLWRALPAPGLRLKVDNCRAGAWPRVLSYPTWADMRCLYGSTVRPGELLLAPTQADGYVRKWAHNDGLPAMRHYSYALQWFSFAALALFLFFKLNYRPLR